MKLGRYILHDTYMGSERAVNSIEVVSLAAKCGKTIKWASDLFPHVDSTVRKLSDRYVIERIKVHDQTKHNAVRTPEEVNAYFTQSYQRWFTLEWSAMQHLFGVV